MRKTIIHYVLNFWRERVLKADLRFLLTLLLLLNYRLSFKVLALFLFIFLKPKFKFSIDRISVFYLALIALSFVNYFFVSNNHTLDHFIIVCCAALFWLASFWTFQRVKARLKENDLTKIINSLRLMVVINLLLSMFDLTKVIIITHALNPYTQVTPPPYGISSGDLIGGVYGGMHLVNTLISAFLFVFFLHRKEWSYSLFSLLPFLLTGSNLATLLLGAWLIWVIVTGPGLLRRYYAVFSLAIIITFYVKITPSNKTYMVTTLTKIAKQFNPSNSKEQPLVAAASKTPEKKQLSKEELIELYVRHKHLTDKNDLTKEETEQHANLLGLISDFHELELKEDIKRATYMSLHKDSLQLSKLRNEFFEYGQLKKFDLNKESGKVTSFKQTFQFLRSHPKYMVFGNGAGSFSSRLAFVTSGIADDSRALKALPHYQDKEFTQNHMAIFKYLMFLDDETHSITNLPFSTYNNLLGEYGLLGFALFLFLYLWYWLKEWKRLSYGKYLLLLFLSFLLFDYWFERLSVIVLFEILMLVNLSEGYQNTVNEES